MSEELASFRIKGMNKLENKLQKVVKSLDDRKKVHGQAVVIGDKWIQDNFTKQGALAYPGTGWKQLSPTTIMMRRKGPKSTLFPKILIDTGTMRSRWKHLWSARQAAIQSGVDYSVKHHTGKDVPERRILPSAEQIMPKLKALFLTWIKGIIS